MTRSTVRHLDEALHSRRRYVNRAHHLSWAPAFRVSAPQAQASVPRGSPLDTSAQVPRGGPRVCPAGIFYAVMKRAFDLWNASSWSNRNGIFDPSSLSFLATRHASVKDHQFSASRPSCNPFPAALLAESVRVNPVWWGGEGGAPLFSPRAGSCDNSITPEIIPVCAMWPLIARPFASLNDLIGYFYIAELKYFAESIWIFCELLRNKYYVSNISAWVHPSHTITRNKMDCWFNDKILKEYVRHVLNVRFTIRKS